MVSRYKTIYTVLVNSQDGDWELINTNSLKEIIKDNNIKFRRAENILTYEQLEDLLSRDIITTADTFVFPTFFDDSLFHVCRLLKKYKKLKCKRVAFWDNLEPKEYLSGNLTTAIKPYIKDFEYYRFLGHLTALNEIYFLSEEMLEIFAAKIPPTRELRFNRDYFRPRLKVQQQPLEYLKTQQEYFADKVKRKHTDIIIAQRLVTGSKGLQDAIEVDFRKNNKTAIIHTNDTFDMLQIKIAGSKICFIPYMRRPCMQLILESILLKTIPLVSDKYKFLDIPDNLFFPNEWLESTETYSIHSIEMQQKIDNILNNYDVILETLQTQSDRDKSKKFLNYLLDN